MPMLDKTGPLGLGPKSGRRRGRCLDGYDSRRVARLFFNRRYGRVLSIAVPLSVAVVRELLKPSGLIRQIVNASVLKKKSWFKPQNLRNNRIYCC